MKHLLFILAIILTYGCTEKNTVVVIDTSYGQMKAELYDSTPKHKENFIKLAKDGYYDGLLFHRVIEGFMIQGGDPDSRNAAPNTTLGNGGPDYKIAPEIGAPHFSGTLAAARQGDAVNPQKKSSGSQFYIVHGKPVTDAELDRIEKKYGITYNEAQRSKYKEVGGTPVLDMEYTVFGELISGFDVLDKIASVQTSGANRPVEDVIMNITIEE